MMIFFFLDDEKYVSVLILNVVFRLLLLDLFPL